MDCKNTKNILKPLLTSYDKKMLTLQ